MFTGITSAELADCLGQIAPVELKGVDLLKQFRPATGAWFPQVPVDLLTEATSQIISYTKECAAALGKLQVLPPISLNALPCMEFCL